MAEVAASDVKAYLGITSADYDTQITAITAAWVAILNTQIIDTYSDDSTYDDILFNGKLLCICGQVQNRLGTATNATGTVGNFELGTWKQSNGSSSSNATVLGAKNPLYEEGMAILKPYMSIDNGMTLSDVALSSTSNYANEFRITRYDSDGNVVSGQEGTMQVF